MDIAKKLFTQKEVNKIFSHIPSKTLRWWGTRDLYGWANEINDGRGVHREYGLGHLFQIGIVEELSSLNIPVGAINKIMRKHFLSGLSMYPLQPDLDKDEIGRGARVNVVDQMNKILVITKTLSGSYKLHINKMAPEYESFLTDRIEAPINIGPGELLLDSVMVFINLERIKNFVDHRICNFTGQRLNFVPADHCCPTC
jgi:hypothetical protein